MERKSDKTTPAKPAETREDRLKAALKANMTRRKAQARARAALDTKSGKGKTGEKGS